LFPLALWLFRFSAVEAIKLWSASDLNKVARAAAAILSAFMCVFGISNGEYADTMSGVLSTVLVLRFVAFLRAFEF